jgi:hypothetical protein
MKQINSDYGDLPADLREILELAGDQENRIPKGLMRCQVCGDWIGRCLGQTRSGGTKNRRGLVAVVKRISALSAVRSVVLTWSDADINQLDGKSG